MDVTGVAYIELHDARIMSLTVERGRVGILRFARVSVFVEKAPELYDVWNADVDLRLNDVSSVMLIGDELADDYLMDDRIWSSDPKVKADGLLSFTETRAIASLQLHLAGGATYDIRAASAILLRLEKTRVFEQWRGPLR